MGFFNFILDKLRQIRFSIGGSPKTFVFGAIYNFQYLNYKHDPRPTAWIQYSDQKYTHGINLNYLDYYEKDWLMKVIYNMKKGNQIMDGFTFYKFMKMQKPSIVKKAYRLYFTNKIVNFKLVSAGVTALDKLVKPFPDYFVKRLNEMITPQSLTETGVQVAYSPEEMMNRINEARNAISISQKPSNAPFAKGNPFSGRAF